MKGFEHRVQMLPHLGIGVSTEYGAHRGDEALDIERLYTQYPEFAAFLEVGVEVDKGLDEDTMRWLDLNRPTTYHFLDINLDDPQDQDAEWMAAVRRHCETLQPAWLCGDAGLWHFGRRERGHMLLLPPILSTESAKEMAEAS